MINSYLLKTDLLLYYGQTIKTASFGFLEEGYENIFKILEGKNLKYSLENIISTKKEQQKEN